MSRDDLVRRLEEDLRGLRAPDGYLLAGAPRYHTLFGRDSLIAAWQTLGHDPTIARDTLRVLARFQGRRTDARAEEEPGKILHEHRLDEASRAELPQWTFPYYGSVDATPLFLVVAHEYVRRTGDDTLLRELWGTLTAAWRWMVRFGDADGDGYLEYERRNPDGLLHQGWKDGWKDHLRIVPPVALVEVQGYAFAAHRAYASLAVRMGEPALARHVTDRAASLFEGLNRDFWMEDRTFFALALDGAKRPRETITSNPGHLLAMGAVVRERVPAVVDRLFREDLWTPYGIRTHSTSEPDFDPHGYHTGTVWPHDNWFSYRGLRLLGYRREADRIRDALRRVHEALGRIPELYAVVDGQLVDLSGEPREGTRANPIQAWSSGALLDMLLESGAPSP